MSAAAGTDILWQFLIRGPKMKCLLGETKDQPEDNLPYLLIGSLADIVANGTEIPHVMQPQVFRVL